MFIKLSFIFWALVTTSLLTSLCVKWAEHRAYHSTAKPPFVLSGSYRPKPLNGWDKTCMVFNSITMAVCVWYLITLP